MNAIATGLGADIDDRISNPRRARIEDAIGARNAYGHGIDQDVAVIGRVKVHLAADGGNPDAISITADPGHHAGDQVTSLGMIGAAEAQSI